MFGGISSRGIDRAACGEDTRVAAIHDRRSPMRRVILVAAASVIALGLVGRAAAAVAQEHDSTHGEVFTFHDTNICGNEAEWTIVVDSRTHAVDMGGGRFEYNFSQVYTYTLVFDDPTLG